jgi:hypothetical protein
VHSSFLSLLAQQDKQNWFSSETMFYFRSLQCRRWVGDPLADALQLPLHPAWTWQRIRLSVVAELYAGCLRLYTWLGQVAVLANDLDSTTSRRDA